MNGVIVAGERKIVTRKLHIGSTDQAFEVLETYAKEPSGQVASALGCNTLQEARVAAFVAARKVAVWLSGIVDNKVADDLGVDLTSAVPAQPTWVDSDGECKYVRDMPSTYLVNILRKYAGNRAGVFNAIRRELDRRNRA